MNMPADRIDVHHHFVPAFYVEAVDKAGGDPSGWPTPKWSLEEDTKFNDSLEIKTAILSLTAPGAGIAGRQDGPALARKVNDYAANIRAGNPRNYGFFAALPDILDTKAAIEEIRYALDVLKADGITLFTRYGSGNHYLGHPDLKPIWNELNAKHAVVFIHPTHPVDTTLVNPRLPQPMIDYTHETTRTAVDLIMSDTVRSCRNCKIILSHAGGSLPYLAYRPAVLLASMPLGQGKSTEEFMEDAREFYFDTALSGSRYTLGLLKEFAKPGHVLFGSDYPYASPEAIHVMTAGLDEFTQKNREQEDVHRKSALELFPRLKS